jgi:intracellular septation protein A
METITLQDRETRKVIKQKKNHLYDVCMLVQKTLTLLLTYTLLYNENVYLKLSTTLLFFLVSLLLLSSTS